MFISYRYTFIRNSFSETTFYIKPMCYSKTAYGPCMCVITMQHESKADQTACLLVVLHMLIAEEAILVPVDVKHFCALNR